MTTVKSLLLGQGFPNRRNSTIGEFQVSGGNGTTDWQTKSVEILIF